MIDTTHNDWTPWQIRNISAIRWLWRGEKEKYAQLLADYKAAIAEADRIAKEAGDAAKLREEAAAVEEAKEKGWRQAKKDLLLKAEKAEALAKARDEIIAEQDWLVSKFGKNGKYKDVPGLCKAASRKEIEEKKFSLNPGAYVGVAPEEDDGVDFAERMGEIRAELAARQKELDKLMRSIDANLEEMGL